MQVNAALLDDAPPQKADKIQLRAEDRSGRGRTTNKCLQTSKTSKFNGQFVKLMLAASAHRKNYEINKSASFPVYDDGARHSVIRGGTN